MIFSRQWAMPNKNTFTIAPIKKFVEKYLSKSKISLDPFARNFQGADITNDLASDTSAQWHLPAEEFLDEMYSIIKQTKPEEYFDLIIFDPPYSPRQISECYKGVGLAIGMKDTQNAALYKRCRDRIDKIISKNGIVISFGWNSNGMGKIRGYEIIELLLVAHGGGHNDTICLAERKGF